MRIPTMPACCNGHQFGKEVTAEQHETRIVWEAWAEVCQRLAGHNAHADDHALSRTTYQELLDRMRPQRLP